ncbi:MAG: xanthine dehydrogenase family protein subunit M [Deltaproteobacteria bacterium]|nr:xanthine dehydrogenase family protein subunit M [Deltaproteobacteria bacterium]
MRNIFRPSEFRRPKDLHETSWILSSFEGRARVVAGGTELLVHKPLDVDCLVGLSKLDLDYIRNGRAGITIGAGTTLVKIEESEALSVEPYRILREATRLLATPTIRNTATIGGNICNASPAVDLPPALMVLDAKVIISGLEGTREIPIADFFEGVKKTVLSDDEFMVEVKIPAFPENTGASFQKLRHHQTSIDIAIVNAAARLSFAGDTVKEAKVAMGSVAATPIYSKKAEEILKGKILDVDIVKRAAEAASGEAKPIDDIRASAGYRKRMVTVLVERALEESARRCGK